MSNIIGSTYTQFSILVFLLALWSNLYPEDDGTKLFWSTVNYEIVRCLKDLIKKNLQTLKCSNIKHKFGNLHMAQIFVAFALWIPLDFEIVSDVLACDDPL